MVSGDSPQFFPNMSNALITNSTITNVSGKAYFNTSERHDLDLLRSKISVAALHNSGERYDAPRCHPGTRVGIQDDIMKWLDDVDDPQLVMWMHGSAGVGKSAIAQAIASLCYNSNPRRLAGAFFLSRTAPAESGRGDEKRLVATLAYQMANNIPCLELHIATAIARNRSVFDLDLETQIKELILDPLAILSAETFSKALPMIFIVDALDECLPISRQARIIQAFVAAMGQIKLPHKLLIASRPESHIKSVFVADDILPLVRSVSLDRKYKAEEDIRKFLVDGFARFKSTHPSPSIFPSVWPGENDKEALVQRCSGHFIYASTAQKYIQEDGANPVHRLQTILGLPTDPINRPQFPAIDALYSYIFRQVHDLENILYFMCILKCCDSQKPSITFCEELLGLSKGRMVLALQGLSSIGTLEGNTFKPYHASLDDFLGDKRRAGDFYIYREKICVHLCCLALEYILRLGPCFEEAGSAKAQLSFCCIIAAQCIKQIQGPRSAIHTILSTFDMDRLFQFFRKMKYWQDDDYYWLYCCSTLFGWIFKEHQLLALCNNMILLSPFSQLQKWTLGQLQRLQLDKHIPRHSLNDLERIFLWKDAEMYVILWSFSSDSWIATSAPRASTKDRMAQLMSQYCYFIRNSSWFNLIRNAHLNNDWTFGQEESDNIGNLCIWMSIFVNHAPPQIDRYLDIKHILGLNPSVETSSLLENFLSRQDYTYWHKMPLLIRDSYRYLQKVEKRFSCLTSILNELDGPTLTAEELIFNLEPSIPYHRHSSDITCFTLALTSQKICCFKHVDTELLLPVM